MLIASFIVLASNGCATVEPAPELPPEPTPTPVLHEQTTVEPTVDDPGTIEDEAEAEGPAEQAVQTEPEDFDPEALQQEALDLCQSASEFLDQGDVDDALAAVDNAYKKMLQLPNEGDDTFVQARDDIRRLVADLIVRTYDAQRAAVAPATSFDLALPLVNNEQVQREIKSFTNGERQYFLDAYRRSGLYRPMILAKLEEAGLPSQLSWLPLVESNFKVTAYSRASAVGLWQFIGSTGQRYGLGRDAWVDERMDPVKSTDAAIAYLTELHDMFGDWQKALAAYNCGEGRVARLQRQNPDEYMDFWDMYNQLPRETRRYVPRFYATLMIVEDPVSFGIELPEPLPPLEDWTTVTVNRSLKLESLEKELGYSAGTLKNLNPELRHGATPKRPYDLRVPSGTDAPYPCSHRRPSRVEPTHPGLRHPHGSPRRNPVPNRQTLRDLRFRHHAVQQPSICQSYLARPTPPDSGCRWKSLQPGIVQPGRGHPHGTPWRQPLLHRPALQHHGRPHPPRQQPDVEYDLSGTEAQGGRRLPH